MRDSLCLKGLMYILIIGLVFVPSASFSQQPETRYFSETDHTVRGQFLQFFNDHGGLDILGPPVSEETMEDGVRVQYFQNTRLEWHPENPRPYRIQPGLLGDLVGEFQPPIPATEIPATHLLDERYYSQTGHTLKHGFLAFFDYYGGLDIFGYPISEMITEPDGRVTQWFQRAQLEWLPDHAGGQVQLAPLGERFLEGKYPDLSSTAGATPTSPGEATVQAFGVEPDAPSAPHIMDFTRLEALKVTASIQNAVTGGPNPGQQ